MPYVPATTISGLKTNIDNLITTNGVGDVSGQDMNDILNNVADLIELEVAADYVVILNDGLNEQV